MPRLFVTLPALVALVVVGVAAPAAAVGAGRSASAVPSSSKGESAPARDERIWISDGRTESDGHESISVKYPPEQMAGGLIAFDCEVRSDDAIFESLLRLEIRDENGNVSFSARLSMPLAKGANPARFEWPTASAPDGEYRARISLICNGRDVAAFQDLVIRRISRSGLQAELGRAADRIGAIARHLGKLADQNDKPAYANARASIAEDALDEARTAAAAQQWPRALDLARYVVRAASGVTADLALLDRTDELAMPLPSRDLGGLTRRDGEFYAGNDPVFLVGVYTTTAHVGDLARLRRYGLNLCSCSVSPSDLLGDATRESSYHPDTLEPFFSEAKRENISLAFGLAQNDMPGWVWQKWPEMKIVSAEDKPMLDMTDPHAQKLMERCLQDVLRDAASSPMVNSVALIERPEFHWGGPEVRAGFTAYVKSVYQTVDSLNNAWRKRFQGFDEVDIWWDYPRPAYQYDWETYHARLGSEFMTRLDGDAKAIAPTVACRVDVKDTVLLAGKRATLLDRENVRRSELKVDPRDQGVGRGETAEGVDREAIADVFDVSGYQASHTMADPVYALDYPGDSFFDTLLRSFAPDKPVMNSCLTLTAPTAAHLTPAQMYRYIHSFIWDSVMSGLNAVAVRADETGSGFWGGIFATPEVREALATASLDVNRLAPIVAAFQQAPADVAILWSMPSKIYGKGHPYLPSVRRAYEGASFGGRKVRFVSERECARDGLSGVSILVLPQALAVSDGTFDTISDFIRHGGIVVRSGVTIPYNQRGASRHAVLPNSAHTVLMRGTDSPSQYLHALDAAYALDTIPDVPRTVNNEGYPFEGVKTEYLKYRGERYLYILNIRRTPVQCHLIGSTQTGRDLIQGRPITFPRLIQPLDPMLIRLAPEPPSPAATGSSGPPRPQEPTAIVKPVKPPVKP